MKRLYLSALLFGLLAISSSASACEICKGWSGQITCWSQLEGRQWCYGGWGEPCVISETYCLEADWLTSGPSLPSEDVCANPIAGCAGGGLERQPTGFVLEVSDSGTERPGRAEAK
jgi:hypothetical protein